MCGITGIFSPDRDRPIAGDRLMAMAGALRHRGPDDPETLQSMTNLAAS